MRRTILLIAFLLILGGCAREASVTPKNNGFVCPDGRMVTDKGMCDVQQEPEPSVTPGTEAQRPLKELEKSGIAVSSPGDAEQVFLDYVKQNNLSYEFVSSEYLRTEGGVDYYRVNYRHDRMGGGIGYLIVTSRGGIYDELPVV